MLIQLETKSNKGSNPSPKGPKILPPGTTK